MERHSISQQDRHCQTPMEEASSKMYAECLRLYGTQRVQSSNVDARDAGSTVGLYVLGPDLARLVGHDATRVVGQDVLLFGAAPIQGVCDAFRDQLQNHLVPMVTEGARNLGFGAAVSVAAELHPAVGAATLMGGTAILAHEELLSEHAKGRNAEIGKIAQRSGNYSNQELMTQAKRMRTLVGEDLYHLGYATVAGGIGVRPGKALAREVAHMELPVPTVPRPGISLSQMRPAFAAANPHDGGLPQLDLIEPLKMSARKIPELNSDGVLPPGVHEATLEQIEARFANNPHRKEIFDRMVHVLRMLKEAGCKRVWINGSFTTSKPNPGDFDVAFDTAGVDFKKLPDSEWFEFPDLFRDSLKANYGGDIKEQVAGNWKKNPVAFFQKDRRAGLSKGIITLDLGKME